MLWRSQTHIIYIKMPARAVFPTPNNRIGRTRWRGGFERIQVVSQTQYLGRGSITQHIALAGVEEGHANRAGKGWRG